MSTFTFEGKNFLLDGKPFRVISGAMHYWRIFPEYWEDRLKKLRACGFNTVETYVPWNLHERREGEFDFSGKLDIVRYISIAESLGLKVIVRPGPYICSEFDFGGLPSWLLSYPDMRLRCDDPMYLEKVRPYYRELLTRIAPHQCTRGGGIIMSQIENEYGSYGDDTVYLRKVAAMYREFGMDCQLYTADGAGFWMLSGGTLPEYPCVANFGSHPEENFAVMEQFRPDQPFMCGEFWCGWFDHWGEAHHTRTPEETLRDLLPMIRMGASFNFYMFHGGTNFGFTNGANHTDTAYLPDVTSYDYGAPLSEAGDLTPAYFAIRDELAKVTGRMPPLDVENTKKAGYGDVTLTERAALLDNLGNLATPIHSASPKTMEEIHQDFGYILYETEFVGPFEKLPLVLGQVHDRAQVYIDGKFADVWERTARNGDVKLALGKGESCRMQILVENCGRVNYGPKLFDKKGLLDGVRLGQRFHFGWEIYPLTMDDLSGLVWNNSTVCDGKPAFLRGKLTLTDKPADTFLRLDGFHKGFVKVNGFNLGRYWNDKGPQKTLYVPAPLLHEGDNEIVVFESDGYDTPVVTFTDTPELG